MGVASVGDRIAETVAMQKCRGQPPNLVLRPLPQRTGLCTALSVKQVYPKVPVPVQRRGYSPRGALAANKHYHAERELRTPC